tara:strand:+ start:199 stop:342 length:144 start_codon:yes stop_codon:yes gene_type:complete
MPGGATPRGPFHPPVSMPAFWEAVLYMGFASFGGKACEIKENGRDPV